MGDGTSTAARLRAEIRARRLSCGLSQQALADRIGYDRDYVSKAETSKRGVPSERLVQLIDRELTAGGTLIAIRAQAVRERQAARVGLTALSEAIGEGAQIFESPFTIVERMARVGASDISNAALLELEQIADDAIEQYETLNPRSLVTQLVRQRAAVEELIGSRLTPTQQISLYRIAAKLSGTLGSLAHEHADHRTARTYCREAYQLSDLAEDRDLRAWVRGTQALVEYYAGKYGTARELIADGLRDGAGGPQEARLLIQGEARAAARLGDHHSVRAAVDRARQVALEFPAGSVSSCLALKGYCSARVAGNAATALLSIGEMREGKHHAFSALTFFDAAGLLGPRSLTRIDIAQAYLSERQLEQGVDLVTEALRISQSRPISAVRARTSEFISQASTRLHPRPIRELAEFAESWPSLERPELPEAEQPT